MQWLALVLVPALVLVAGCSAPSGPMRVRLAAGQVDSAALRDVRAAFEANNPGYALDFVAGAQQVMPSPDHRIAFVQRGEGAATVTAAVSRSGGGDDDRAAASEIGVGDLVLLRPGAALAVDAPVDLLVFGVPQPLGDDLPTFLRPDWHPGITDVPGGCATETGAYRRVVLTWLRRNGPFNYRALNAHRVRITDSFTHYHPQQGGFDEFYLVQMVQPGARLLTSTHTADIVAESVDKAAAAQLLVEWDLQVGDLIYLPRGTVHRGLGGVLAHVITTPGFVPGSELGVDHHLAAINRKLGLEGEAALPVHAEGATRIIRR